MMPSRYFRHPNGPILIASSLLVASLILVALAFVVRVTTPGTWDPFGQFPPQQITSTINGIQGPAARADGAVHVVATKCYDEPTAVVGSLIWRPVNDPAKSVLVLAEQPATRATAGCFALEFDNPIPAEVLARVCADGLALWQIVGSETAIDASGRRGATKVWETQVFTLVAGEAACSTTGDNG